MESIYICQNGGQYFQIFQLKTYHTIKIAIISYLLTATLILAIIHLFEAGIADTIASFKGMKNSRNLKL